MSRTIALVLSTGFLLACPLAVAESFTVPAHESTPLQHVLSKDTLTLSGHIEMVPMSGLTVVFVTPSMGQIIIGKRYNLPKELGSQFDTLKSAGTTVEMRGVVLTFCSEKQIKQGTIGCRMFDPTHPISAKTY